MSAHPCGCDPEANWVALDCQGPNGCLSFHGKVSLPARQNVVNETNPRLPLPDYKQELSGPTNPRADLSEPLYAAVRPRMCSIGAPCNDCLGFDEPAPILVTAAGTEQPAPIPQAGGCIQDLVIADIEARKALGLERYGTLLQPFNGRDALLDAYQEALDLCQYLRQALEERYELRRQADLQREEFQ